MLCMLGKIFSRQDIEIFILFFSEKRQRQFSEKKKDNKSIISLSAAEFAQRHYIELLY